MRYLLFILSLAALYAFSCARSGSGRPPVDRFAEEIEARFFNGPVKGVTVKRSSGSETTTGEGGVFRCLLAEEVSFELAGVYIGSSACADYVFLTSLINSANVAGWSRSKAAALIQTFALPEPATGPLQQLNIEVARQALSELGSGTWSNAIYSQASFDSQVSSILASAKSASSAASSSEFQAKAAVTSSAAILTATERFQTKVRELNDAMSTLTYTSLQAIYATNPGDIVARAQRRPESCITCPNEYKFDLNLKSITMGSRSLLQVEGYTSPDSLGGSTPDGTETVTPLLGARASLTVKVSDLDTMNFYFWVNSSGRPEGVSTLVRRNSSGEITSTGRYNLVVNAAEDGSSAGSGVGASPVRPSGTLQNFERLGATLPVPLELAASLQIGSKVYLIGGETDTDVTNRIYEATVNSDGSIGAFTDSSLTIATARKGARVERIGNSVYLIGGFTDYNQQTSSTPLNTIERAPCDENGLTAGFSSTSLTLDQGRYNFLTLVTQGFIYAIGGGISSTFQSNTISRAPINTTTGEITANFETLTREVVSADEVKNGLVDARWTHNGIRIGN